MSTSYTTGGQPVAASATFPNSEADATMMGATGAGGATTSQETAYDATRGIAGTGQPAAPRLMAGSWGGLAVILVSTAVALYLVRKWA